jgi:hypothetical protein
MAPPIFLGSFKGNFRSPVSVRNWVGENVPCTRGAVPKEWTHAIYAKLRQSHVDPAVIQAGLILTRADGYVFDDAGIDPATISPVRPPSQYSPLIPISSLGAASESPKQARIHVMEVLEHQFEKAKLNNNYGEMRRLAQEFADLLNSSDAGRTSEDQEMQWGAPMLRRSVVRNADGSDPAPRGGGGGGPYRPLYVPVPIMEGEGEAEED